MYISRLRPHDADTKRRQFAIEKAQKYDNMRTQFIKHCKLHGVSQAEMEKGLYDLARLASTWKDVSEQGMID